MKRFAFAVALCVAAPLHWRPIFRHLRRCRGLRNLLPIAPIHTTGAASISAAILVLVGTGAAAYSDTFGSAFSGSRHDRPVSGRRQVGVNYQFWGGVVVGAEAMFDWLPNTRTRSTQLAAGLRLVIRPRSTLNNRWLTTATGKLGYAWDRVLVYGKGGGAWVGASANLDYGQWGTGCGSATSSTANFGWTAGFGVEWAFAGSWSARAEYDFIGLENQTLTVALPASPFGGDLINVNNRNINMFTAGLNYKFGGGWW